MTLSIKQNMLSETTIIFIHGLGLSGEVWTPQLEWCRKNKINSVSLTLPGHGKRRDENVSIENMVNEIVDTAKKYPKVMLVGHSFGAYLCQLAAVRLDNVEFSIYINPLFDYKQFKRLFLIAIRTAKIIQHFFGVGGPGDYLKGTEFFWKYGIYLYCLRHNSAAALENIVCQLKRRKGDKSLSRPTRNTKVLFSAIDALLRRPATPGDTVPIAGHMLMRLSPEAVNHFLAQAVSHPEGHRV